ncbi:MAG: lactate utilization protein [Promethearchaeota archaeon]
MITIKKEEVIKEKDKKEKWTHLPSSLELLQTIENIEYRNIDVLLVNNREEALEKIKQKIPEGVKVMTGSSTTLYEIGFMDYYLSGKTPWTCLGPMVYQETNPEKQRELRRVSETADYFIASVNAIAKTGELVAADASGSRVSAYPYAAEHVILVAGIQKITPNLEKSLERIREYVYPLENERALKAYGIPSSIGKWVIIEREKIDHRITLILVKEELGY